MMLVSVRADTWLWAARFFKSRAKAKEAITAGKVRINSSRFKPSKQLKVKDELSIRQGWDEKVIIVKAVSDERRSASIAEKLYAETQESIEKRKVAALGRKAAGALISQNNPNKRERRLLHKFRQRNLH